MKKIIAIPVITALLSFSHLAAAGAILIINGSSSTIESDTTSAITNNLRTLHIAAGNTVTVVDTVPIGFAGFSQVWDIRFSESGALTTANRTSYLSYLQGGGGMFVMGENSRFMARNRSIFGLIGDAGGGSIGPNLIGDCDGVQNVIGPFRGPNAVASVDFNCSGVVASRGTGNWITSRADNSGGSGIAFGAGSLSLARLGALTTIFDVNFMSGSDGAGKQELTKNLIGFIEQQVNPGGGGNNVPLPGSLALLGLGLLGIKLRARK